VVRLDYVSTASPTGKPRRESPTRRPLTGLERQLLKTWATSYWLRGEELDGAIERIRQNQWSKFLAEALVFQTVRTFRLAGGGTDSGFRRLEGQLSGLKDIGESLASSIVDAVQGLMRRLSGVDDYWPSRWRDNDEIRAWSVVECSLLAIVDGERISESLDKASRDVRIPVEPTETVGRERWMSAEQLRDQRIVERLREIGLIGDEELV
jgi:hypothetical protein